MRKDCYIPGFKNDDPDDMCRNAKVRCSSSISGSNCELVYSEDVKGNYLRHRVHLLKSSVDCTRLRIDIYSTNGDKHARIFEVRAY